MPMKRKRYRRRRRASLKRLLICVVLLLSALFVLLSIWLISLLLKSPKAPEGATTSTTQTQQDDGTTIHIDGLPTSQGWFILNDKAYYGTEEGKFFVGTHTIDGKKYTFHTDGALVNGWMQMGNLRYHFKDGVMSKGTTEIDGKVCHINSDGSMFVGWYDAANGYRLYYDIETGVAFTGWHEIEGKHYCFDAAGFLYTSTTADGVPVDENGVADETVYQAYIGNTTVGTTVSTVQQNTTSANTQNVDMAALNQKLDKILEKYGRTPRNIYDYVHDHYTYKHAAEGSIEENAVYLLENGTGSCYHFASLTYMLFKRAGYETHYVTGLGWQNHTYHCWILAKFDGGWYHVDSLYVRSAKLTSADLKRIGYEWDESAYPS